MKTLILSTVAVAVIALSAGSAFASRSHGDTDNGADIMLQGLGEKYATPGQLTDQQDVSGQTATTEGRAVHTWRR